MRLIATAVTDTKTWEIFSRTTIIDGTEQEVVLVRKTFADDSLPVVWTPGPGERPWTPQQWMEDNPQIWEYPDTEVIEPDPEL